MDVRPSDTLSPSGLMSRIANRTGRDRLFGVNIRRNENARFGLDNETANSFQRYGIILLIFYVVMTLIGTLNDARAHRKVELSNVNDTISELARQVDSNLSQAVAWTETAISSAGTPARMVSVAARGQNVAGAAVIRDGLVLADVPSGVGTFLAGVASDAPSSGVEVNSLIAENGDANPVILRPVEAGTFAVAYAPRAFVNSAGATTLLVTATGRIVDAPASVVRTGLAGVGLPPDTLAYFTQGSNTTTVDARSLSGTDVWIASARIPNSDLSVIQIRPRTTSPRFWPQLGQMAVVAFGSLFVIYILMNTLLKRMDLAHDTFVADEVTRQRYRAALEGTGGGIFEIDIPNDTVFMSPRLVEALNLGQGERTLPLAQFLGLFHDSSHTAIMDAIRRAHMNGTFRCDAYLRHAPMILECEGRPILRTNAGEDVPTRKVIIGVAHDVTDQRGAEARVRAAEARLLDALSSMSDAFVIWDRHDQLVLWNHRYEDFFGFHAGNLEAGMDRARIEYHANAAIAERSEVPGSEGEAEIQLTDGRYIHFAENVTADGGRVTVATDITDVRHREVQLRQNSDVLQYNLSALQSMQSQLLELAQNYEQEKIRAEEANQSKSEFLANMSHELRTPLNAINGFSDIMQKEMFGPLGDPRYKEYVSDILFSGKHLLSLINDILDMSKIEAGKMTLNVGQVDVSSVIEQVIRIVRGRAEENRLKLIYESSDTPPIEADPRAIKQVLLNLISNAIKFTPEGGAVRVDCTARPAGLMVRVSDSGMGISDEDIARLAQPFEQASNNKSGEGTGLGLALSKSLVELHGGEFHIASKLGEGTTITFALPSRPAAAATAPHVGVSEEISRIASTISDALNQGRGPGEAGRLPSPQVPVGGRVNGGRVQGAELHGRGVVAAATPEAPSHYVPPAA